MTSTTSFIPVCPLSDIDEGSIGCAQLEDGTQIALYRVDGEVFASDDQCTHGASSLCYEGTLDGHTVECGMHFGAFDIRTGEAVSPPCVKALRTYPAEVRDGTIWISVAKD